MQTKRKYLILALSISLLTGCAMGTKDDLLPQTGPTMMEVYKDQMQSASISKQPKLLLPTRAIKTGTEELIGYTRTSQTEISNQFPTLPNPTLVMYVYPHLTGFSNHPVPGYSTSFTLYEKAQYALPGEVR